VPAVSPWREERNGDRRSVRHGALPGGRRTSGGDMAPLTGRDPGATALPTTTTVHKLRTKSLRSSPPSLRSSVPSVLSPCEVLACRNRRAIHASQRGHAVGCRGADRWVSMPNGAPREPWSGAGCTRIGPDAGAVAIRGREGVVPLPLPSHPPPTRCVAHRRNCAQHGTRGLMPFPATHAAASGSPLPVGTAAATGRSSGRR
jgi:hypothetical protein